MHKKELRTDMSAGYLLLIIEITQVGTPFRSHSDVSIFGRVSGWAEFGFWYSRRLGAKFEI